MRRIKFIISFAIIGALAIAGYMSIPSAAYAKASSASSQNYANIVLFAYCSGDNADEDKAYFEDQSNRDTLIDIYEGSSGRSVKNYLSTISYDKFHIKNIFPQDDGTKIEAYQLSETLSQVQSQNLDYNIIKELIAAVPSVNGQTVDYDGDGFIDNVTVIIKGEDSSSSSSSVSIHSHKNDFQDASEKWLGKSIGSYNFISTSRLLEARSGVVCHEFLHSLGYPDLYNSNAEQPVGLWDIMGSTMKTIQYPLAYLRMNFTKWLDIDTVTASASGLRLDTQDNADGNQAYILKSPYNENELFVVEFRKKATRSYTSADDDKLDYSIGGSGLIVYRVDTTVEGLSNHFGETGIYIFRPTYTQLGLSSNNPTTCLYYAFLSKESGRTTIWSSDLDKGLTDGALTFTDGTNSGIVISNISESSGSSMTFDVTIPEVSKDET